MYQLPNELYRVKYLTGTIQLEPLTWTLYRVKPTGWFKWFKKDRGILECEQTGIQISGEYDHITMLVKEYMKTDKVTYVG